MYGTLFLSGPNSGKVLSLAGYNTFYLVGNFGSTEYKNRPFNKIDPKGGSLVIDNSHLSSLNQKRGQLFTIASTLSGSIQNFKELDDFCSIKSSPSSQELVPAKLLARLNSPSHRDNYTDSVEAIPYIDKVRDRVINKMEGIFACAIYFLGENPKVILHSKHIMLNLYLLYENGAIQLVWSDKELDSASSGALYYPLTSVNYSFIIHPKYLLSTYSDTLSTDAVESVAVLKKYLLNSLNIQTTIFNKEVE